MPKSTRAFPGRSVKIAPISPLNVDHVRQAWYGRPIVTPRALVNFAIGRSSLIGNRASIRVSVSRIAQKSLNKFPIAVLISMLRLVQSSTIFVICRDIRRNASSPEVANFNVYVAIARTDALDSCALEISDWRSPSTVFCFRKSSCVWSALTLSASRDSI